MIKSTDTLLFYAFGQPATVHIDSINPDYVHFTLAGHTRTIPFADFQNQWGGAPCDEDNTPISHRLHPLHFTLMHLRQIHYGEQIDVTIVARWKEKNATHYRMHDSFGGSHTYCFHEDGLVTRSEHESYEFVTRLNPYCAA